MLVVREAAPETQALNAGEGLTKLAPQINALAAQVDDRNAMLFVLVVMIVVFIVVMAVAAAMQGRAVRVAILVLVTVTGESIVAGLLGEGGAEITPAPDP